MNTSDDLPSPVPALFPARGARERVDDLLTRELANANERIARGSVMPRLDMARFRQELAGFDFERPQSVEQLLAWSVAQLEHGAVHMTHPRYFGLFNPAPVAPSQWADRIVSAFNPQLASSGSSPAPVEIEAHVIRAIARRAGLPADAAGHFTASGSEANYTSLICALTRAEPRFSAEGVRAFSGPVALYTSRECHPAWSKIAHQAGVGRSALRLVATDGNGRMDSHALAGVVARDREQGVVPVLIAATAGTTGGGMIDPLASCAAVARSQGVWYHVDAAWGGAALASERLRGLLAGIELADSLTIDAHKWFATTMGCGMFVLRDAAVLSEAFRVATDFMPSNASSLDPYLTTVQWSRRFLGLRLFLSLAAAGWIGYGAHVERAVEVIAQVKSRLQARGWQAINDSSLAVLCVVPPAETGEIREIVRNLLSSGRAWVARSTFEGREVIRICATHGETTLADVDELVSALHTAG
ncbi:MAG: pyridoxal-dependent decarboxylase [Gammaproteobacteria bacterium]|jgi:aromatic-L-amino-acid decarboxylase|nr:pyridoxal-dependent decarboxylase [Gammaproteobacteria bacterium]